MVASGVGGCKRGELKSLAGSVIDGILQDLSRYNKAHRLLVYIIAFPNFSCRGWLNVLQQASNALLIHSLERQGLCISFQ